MTIIQTSQNLKSFADRFWQKVQKGDSCWEWTGGRYNHPRGGKSYGCFSVGSRTDGSKRMVAAHKVAWELEHGAIANGMKVLHRCDNPVCVRPDHLFLGSQAENIKDMVEKGRAWWQRGSA